MQQFFLHRPTSFFDCGIGYTCERRALTSRVPTTRQRKYTCIVCQELDHYVIDELLGLHLMDRTPDIDDETKRLLIARQRARDERDWTVSDQLRDQLTEKGIAVSDTPSGQVWRYA